MKAIFTSQLRFCDPILSLCVNTHTLVYGTAYGKISIYDITSSHLQTVTEISEECVSSISLVDDNHAYLAIGDYYCIHLLAPFKNCTPRIIHYSKIHSDEDCCKSITFIHKSTACLMSINGGNIYLLDLSTKSSKLYDPLPPYSIPLDYYNEKILIQFFHNSRNRQFSHFCIQTGITEAIFSVPSDFGHITSMKMFKDGLIFIHNYKNIGIWKYSEEEVTIWEDVEEIKAMGICELEESLWVGIITGTGNVKIFKDSLLYNESKFPIDFDKDYPYFLSIHPPYLSFSTDSSVTLINFSLT